MVFIHPASFLIGFPTSNDIGKIQRVFPDADLSEYMVVRFVSDGQRVVLAKRKQGVKRYALLHVEAGWPIATATGNCSFEWILRPSDEPSGVTRTSSNQENPYYFRPYYYLISSEWLWVSKHISEEIQPLKNNVLIPYLPTRRTLLIAILTLPIGHLLLSVSLASLKIKRCLSGRCINCGYPRGDSCSRCPECGIQQDAKSVSA
jgi:hypothetical protein